jgi:hypothetical protein
MSKKWASFIIRKIQDRACPHKKPSSASQREFHALLNSVLLFETSTFQEKIIQLFGLFI